MLFAEGTVGLVTGASKGIGAACATDLAREGATVVVNYNTDEEGAKATVAEIEAFGGRAVAIRADVTDELAVKRMFQQIRLDFGRLDVLVANAGITRDALMMQMSVEDFEKVVRTNVTGVFICCREAFRLMSLNRHGSIVALASVTAQGFPAVSNYAASKGAIVSFAKSIATEGAVFNVRANAVSPGLVETAMVRKMPAEVREAILRNTALARGGTPQELANVVSFLASDKASYVTGAEILVDGGASLGLVVDRSQIDRGKERRRRIAGAARDTPAARRAIVRGPTARTVHGEDPE